jgi:hypothetical protein
MREKEKGVVVISECKPNEREVGRRKLITQDAAEPWPAALPEIKQMARSMPGAEDVVVVNQKEQEIR